MFTVDSNAGSPPASVSTAEYFDGNAGPAKSEPSHHAMHRAQCDGQKGPAAHDPACGPTAAQVPVVTLNTGEIQRTAAPPPALAITEKYEPIHQYVDNAKVR